MASKRETGQVKWFNRQKGFGFIKVDGTLREAFVHYSKITKDDADEETGDRKDLWAGDRVSFDLIETEKGPQAVDVVVTQNSETRGQF
jgi:CspA family cold shock protein